MTDKVRASRLLRPETLTAIGLLIASVAFLIPTAEMRPLSALLPAAMLIATSILSVILLISDQRKAAAGEPAAAMTKSPGRVLGALALIVLYTLAVDFIGFYPATAVSVPLVAWTFGYRHPLGLLTATAIVLGFIWLVFSFAMSQEFPVGRLWEI